MNNTELAEVIHKSAGISKLHAHSALRAMLRAMTAAIGAGQIVSIEQMGTFKTRIKAAHVKRNPRNQQPVNVPSKTVVSFKCAKALFDVLN